MSLREEAIEGLRSGSVADLGYLLKPGGRREVEDEVARIAAGGLRAHVLVAPLGADLAPLHAVWDELEYRTSTDLLLLFDGRRWEARGWNLSPAAVETALDRARPELRLYYGRGLARALAELAAASKGKSDAHPKSRVGLGVAAAGLALAAGLAWVMVRRTRRSKENRRTLTEARSSADQVFAEVLLAAEEMTGPEAAALREKATRLREQLDALAPPGVKQLPPKEESLTLARLLQTENELEALRSRVLQVKRRS